MTGDNLYFVDGHGDVHLMECERCARISKLLAEPSDEMLSLFDGAIDPATFRHLAELLTKESDG